MKYVVGLTVLVLTLIVVGVSSQFGELPVRPDRQLLLNATVITMDARRSSAQAMLWERERVIWTGSNQEAEKFRDSVDAIHDLKGKTVVPGFIDAHGHFPGSGLTEFAADLNSPPIGKLRSLADLQSRLRTFAEQNPKGWILGIGYDDGQIKEKRHPTREDLDAVSTERPVYIMHISGHMGVANSAALAAAGISADTENPEGGVIVKDTDGQPTGLLQETAGEAVQALAMDFSAGDFLQMVDAAAAEYLAVGVTTAQSGGVDPAMLQGLWLASTLRRIPQRFVAWPLWKTMGESLVTGERDPTGLNNSRFQVGAIKIIADGSIQGYTGYLGQPYETPYHGDAQYHGFPVVGRQALNKQVMSGHTAGYQLAIHGNGDAAIDMILEAVEKAQRAMPRPDARHILVHAQMAREDQLLRMKALGITPSFFSAHTFYWGDRHRDIFMGPERAARMSPAQSAEQIGLPYSIHLDTPVVPMDPMLLIWSAVNRLSASGEIIGARQRISAEQALAATTINAAWQIHREQDIGSLEPGKLADFVVLDRNPLQVPPEALKTIRVEQTYIDGRLYYSR